MAAPNGESAHSTLAHAFLGLKMCDPEPSMDDILNAFNDFSVSQSAIDVSQRSVAALQNLHELHFAVRLSPSPVVT
jgi:hypothetical protein